MLLQLFRLVGHLLSRSRTVPHPLLSEEVKEYQKKSIQTTMTSTAISSTNGNPSVKSSTSSSPVTTTSPEKDWQRNSSEGSAGSAASSSNIRKVPRTSTKSS